MVSRFPGEARHVVPHGGRENKRYRIGLFGS